MNKKSWVHDLTHISFSDEPIIMQYHLTSKDLKRDGSFAYLDAVPFFVDNFKANLFSHLKNKGVEFDSEDSMLSELFGSKEAYSICTLSGMELLWDKVWTNFLVELCMCYGDDTGDWGFDKIDYKDICYRDTTITLCIIPQLVEYKGAVNDMKQEKITWNMIFDIPGVGYLDKDGNFKRANCSGLGGFYAHVLNLIAVSTPGDSEGPIDDQGIKTLFHENYHQFIRMLTDGCGLSDLMYGEDRAIKSEEIHTHFVTDCFEQLKGLDLYCRSIMFERDPDLNLLSVTLPKLDMIYDCSDESGCGDSWVMSEPRKYIDMIAINHCDATHELSNHFKDCGCVARSKSQLAVSTNFSLRDESSRLQFLSKIIPSYVSDGKKCTMCKVIEQCLKKTK